MAIEKIIEDLKNEINNISFDNNLQSVGQVMSVSDGIAKVSGLSDVMSMEMLEFEKGQKGIAFNLEQNEVGVVVLGDYSSICEGDSVNRTNQILSIGVSDDFIGRVVSPLGKALDGGSALKPEKYMHIERVAPGVMSRQGVNQPLQTGIKSIDAMIPIGRGQRELIIGDRQTGKTTIAIDTIINQKGKDVICVYVAIGQKESKIAQLVEDLKNKGAMDYTVIVLAGASHGSAMQFLSPYSGVAVAEYFMDKQKDVLVVYDDLSKHAIAYREMSLLLKRPPGREAFPGDVFYLHSRLLERACRRNAESGGGSITALPIVETQGGDISGYIPTNVISITDGQIFTDGGLFYKGIRPAVDVGLSVSRVGGSAQTKAMKKNAGKMKLSLAQYRELESFSQFDSDLDPSTKSIIERGKRTVELLKQKNQNPMSVGQQVLDIYAINNGFLDNINVVDVADFESKIQSEFLQYKKELDSKLAKDWNDDIEKELKEFISDFVKGYKK